MLWSVAQSIHSANDSYVIKARLMTTLNISYIIYNYGIQQNVKKINTLIYTLICRTKSKAILNGFMDCIAVSLLLYWVHKLLTHS
jgi:hypothetical protein